MNNTFLEISDAIKKNNSFLIFPHINIDGDTLGSAVALCKALRKIGKDCYVLIEDDIPGNLEFLDGGYCTYDEDVIRHHDVSICIDCGDLGRFPKRVKKFNSGKTSICIDHHETTNPFCQLNYIDSNAAATGQLVYYLIKEMDIDMDKEMGEALFAAITTDTGNFQYSNTTGETHEIVADLYNYNIDSNKVSIEIYQSLRIEKLLIKKMALDTLTILAGGKAAIAYVTKDMFKQSGAYSSETEGIVEDLRSIKGVEMVAFLKESEEGKVKVSLRAKHIGNVASISTKFHGGGHEKAAGCTIHGTITEAFDLIKKEMVKNLEEYDI